MEIKIIKSPIAISELKRIAEQRFGDLVKAAVDIEQEIMAIGGELHVDEQILLIEKENSKHEDVWGINLYPDNFNGDFIQFDSMINIRPSQQNRSRGIEHEDIRQKIRNVVERIILT